MLEHVLFAWYTFQLHKHNEYITCLTRYLQSRCSFIQTTCFFDFDFGLHEANYVQFVRVSSSGWKMENIQWVISITGITGDIQPYKVCTNNPSSSMGAGFTWKMALKVALVCDDNPAIPMRHVSSTYTYSESTKCETT